MKSKCPYCKRATTTDEVELYNGHCVACRTLGDLPNTFGSHPPESMTDAPERLRRRRPRADYPVSRVCPECGAAEFKQRRPEKWIAFTWDRVCRACDTRYTPPTPRWAALVFILAGMVLLPVGVVGVIGSLFGLVMGRLDPISTALTVGLGILGGLALRHGIRAFIASGKV